MVSGKYRRPLAPVNGEGEADASGDRTVQVHSPDSRLQPSRLIVPGPPGDESVG